MAHSRRDGTGRARAFHRASSTQWVMWPRSANSHTGPHRYGGALQAGQMAAPDPASVTPEIRTCAEGGVHRWKADAASANIGRMVILYLLAALAIVALSTWNAVKGLRDGEVSYRWFVRFSRTDQPTLYWMVLWSQVIVALAVAAVTIGLGLLALTR